MLPFQDPGGWHQTVVGRAPAAWLAGAAVIGIVVDRMLEVPLTWWLTILVSALLARWGASPRQAVLCLFLAWTAAWGGWHHVRWYTHAADSIVRLVQEESAPISLTGRIVEPSWTVVRGDKTETIALLDCTQLPQPGGEPRPLSGRVRIVVDGPITTLLAGTMVTVNGRLMPPRTALNPGDFEYQDWLRSQGIEAVVRVGSGEAIQALSFVPQWRDRVINLRRELRQQTQQALSKSTFKTTPAVAEALLLGTRTQLPGDLRQAFMESGTLHVLAISGVNVGVIWIGLVRAARGLGLSYRWTALVVFGGLGGYVWLTDANPPIVRAVTFAALVQFAELIGRRIGPLQGLSLTLVWLLLVNPADLFNPGAQLSYLSVAALATVMPYLMNGDAVMRPSPDMTGREWRRVVIWKPLGLWMWQANVTTAAVWFVTLPLVLWRFHLCSPVGFVLNVFLGPYVWLMLWMGYLWLTVLAIAPALSPAFLFVFELLLQGLVLATQWTAAWDSGHGYVAGPEGWWVGGFYACLVWGLCRGQNAVRVVTFAVLAWINVGLFSSLVASGPSGLTCDILGVGHGLAVIVEMPSGKLLAYDAGSLGNPEQAANAVCQAVWQRKRRRLDALVVSHADSDHCNAVPMLTDRLSCGTLLLHETFLRSRTPTASAVVSQWGEHAGDGRLIATGDRIVLDPDVEIEVLHPPWGFQGERDNANSLVLMITYAGRRILLTGDLERDGLSALLDSPRRPVDMLLSPHHGSRNANPAELGAWTNPTWLVASASDRHILDRVQDNFAPETQRHSTAQTGRVRCRIFPNGQIDVTTFRSR
ncbi:MAG: ComEC/Rec2 family competence protein [Planctomycetaceae bacterium]|nr:ComEC/Rec2 family competence protein [Planctomycetaceae bacterium]